MWGRLSALDAAALARRIAAMVTGVCAADPRTVGERWADAVGALGHGNDHLACRCGAPGCPAAQAPGSNVVVRVIADQAAVDAAQELIAAQNATQRPSATPNAEQRPNTTPNTEQQTPAPAPTPAPTPTPSAPPAPAPAVSKDCGVALLPGRGVVPTVVLAEALRGGAKVVPLWLPGAAPEPGYRPSARLAEFIRVRDLFCRFPNCDVPADRCDIDHVIPWPLGPTHPSNLNCKCRSHHLMKTFWGGPGGWSDAQSPDGTVSGRRRMAGPTPPNRAAGCCSRPLTPAPPICRHRPRTRRRIRPGRR